MIDGADIISIQILNQLEFVIIRHYPALSGKSFFAGLYRI